MNSFSMPNSRGEVVEIKNLRPRVLWGGHAPNEKKSSRNFGEGQITGGETAFPYWKSIPNELLGSWSRQGSIHSFFWSKREQREKTTGLI